MQRSATTPQHRAPRAHDARRSDRLSEDRCDDHGSARRAHHGASVCEAGGPGLTGSRRHTRRVISVARTSPNQSQGIGAGYPDEHGYLLSRRGSPWKPKPREMAGAPRARRACWSALVRRDARPPLRRSSLPCRRKRGGFNYERARIVDRGVLPLRRCDYFRQATGDRSRRRMPVGAALKRPPSRTKGSEPRRDLHSIGRPSAEIPGSQREGPR